MADPTLVNFFEMHFKKIYKCWISQHLYFFWHFLKKFTSVGSSANFLSPKPNGQGFKVSHKMKNLHLQADWATVLVIEWALSFKSLVKRTWIGTISISIVYVLTYDQPLCTISIGSVPWFWDKNCVYVASSFVVVLEPTWREVQ